MKIKLPMFSKQSLIEASGWIVFIIGFISYVTGYIILYNKSYISPIWSNAEYWANLCISLGDILLVGGVVGFLTSVAQWKGVFTEELTNVIYGKELLSKRTDLKTIWENTTKQMFKYKFRCIHSEILDTMSNYLPDDNEISYYDNFTEDIVIKWKDKPNGIVTTTETMVFDIVAETKEEVDYSVKSTTKISSDIGEPEDCVKHSVFVDEKEFKDVNTIHTRVGGYVVMESKLKLSTATKYKFKFVIEKTYSIFEDYTIAYRAKRYIHNMHVSLLLDDGLSAEFIDRGSYEPFQEVKKSKQNIIMTHSGVIFPKQGFIFAISVNK